MKAKKKNNKSNVSEFIRYIRGEMTKREENAFQKKLQKDPFAEEAEEGLSRITAENAESDFKALQKRLDIRTNRRSPVIFYRIAASVAVLVVISTIFILTQRDDQVVTLSENISEEKMPPAFLEKDEPILAKDITEPDIKEEIPSSKEVFNSDDLPDANEVIEQKIEELKVAESVRKAVIDSGFSEPVIAQETAYIAEARSVDREESKKMVRVEAAPASLKSVASVNNYPPKPIVGQDSFNIYLEKNIRKPEPEKSEPQVAVVSFKVLTDSTLTNIRIISSPGEAYSTESIRLIKEGPLWIPAEENGIKTEEEVTIRIVFK